MTEDLTGLPLRSNALLNDTPTVRPAVLRDALTRDADTGIAAGNCLKRPPISLFTG
jgi:hypothetical protein